MNGPGQAPLAGATKDQQSIAADGELLQDHIAGVLLRPVQNIVTRSGTTTEVYSQPWGLLQDGIRHAIQVTLNAFAISAWHLHERQTDHIYSLDGTLEVVLYDDRHASPTRGRVEVLRLTRLRPQILKIPPLVWHGVRNVDGTPTSFLNYFDVAYCHADPDEWRLPWDTDRIPHQFDRGRAA